MGRAADLPHVFSVIQQVFVEHLLHARTGVAVLTGTDMFPQRCHCKARADCIGFLDCFKDIAFSVNEI